MIAFFSILLSVLAFGFSFLVFVDSRRRDRRDVFLKINEHITSEDILRGRYVLHQKVTDEASVQSFS